MNGAFNVGSVAAADPDDNNRRVPKLEQLSEAAAAARREAYLLKRQQELAEQKAQIIQEERRAAQLQMDASQVSDSALNAAVKQEIMDQLSAEPALRGQSRPNKKKRRKNKESSAYSYRKKRKLKKDRKRRAPTKWVRALKQFNAEKVADGFFVPRRGTNAYAMVQAIMAQM